MKIKRFFAKDMRTALKEVKEVLGVDAVIMSKKKLADGIELVAAIDESELANKQPAPPEPAIQMPLQKMARKPPQVARGEQPPLTRPIPRGAAKVTPRHQYQQASSNAGGAQSAVSGEDLSFAAAFNGGTDSGLEQRLEAHFDEGFSAVDQHAQRDSLHSINNHESAPADSLSAILERQASQAKKQIKQSRLNPAFAQSEVESVQSIPQSTPSTPSFTSDMSQYKQQMTMMQQEMSSIRKMLTHQVSGLMWQEMERREPTRAFLVTQLKKMGLTDQVADQLACFVPEGLDDPEAWQTVIDLLKGQINTTNNEILSHGGVFSLIGPTGVGKTTTVAKLAARFAQQHGADQVGLVTTDTFRIGAHEQLSTFGKIIGCPVKVAKNAEDLANVLFQLRNRKLILIDTAGMSQRDIRLCEQLTTLMKNSRVKIKSYLVLSATVQYNVLQETVSHFKKIPLAGCIFTKIDECLSLGELVSIAIQNGLPIGYLTNGQRVPEDIEVANGSKIVAQAEGMLKQTEQDNEYQWHLDNHTQAVGMYD